MTKNFDIAVVGATGIVGEALLEILAEREFPVENIFPLATAESEGATVMFNGKAKRVRDVSSFDFSQVQIAFFVAGEKVAEMYGSKAAAAGCVVIDTSQYFTNARSNNQINEKKDGQIPVIVPEVNSSALAEYKNHRIIASPSAATIQLLVALKPIYDSVGIERINVCTYQSVSGAGRSGVEELAAQTAQLLNGRGASKKVFTKQIAFNCFPDVGGFDSQSESADECEEQDVSPNTLPGYSREEIRIVQETQQVLADSQIRVNPTCVRIPVFYAHSEAVHIETLEPISAEQARRLLSRAPGVKVLDKPSEGGYPTPVKEATGQDLVWVSRIREDCSHGRGLNLWIVADNVRKGAALNCVQIAELLIKTYL